MCEEHEKSPLTLHQGEGFQKQRDKRERERVSEGYPKLYERQWQAHYGSVSTWVLHKMAGKGEVKQREQEFCRSQSKAYALDDGPPPSGKVM